MATLSSPFPAQLFAWESLPLRLTYQPIYETLSGDIVAVEALVRLWSAEGLLPPASFLPLAEANGEIAGIDAWVLRTACAQAGNIEQAVGRPVRMNVNVSAQLLQSKAFARIVRSALTDSGLPGTSLQLEVTEQELVESISATAHSLDLVRGLGVTIAIDDFGTGYNTLRYLKAFPVECIKVDGDFVRDVETNRFSREICSSVIDLGNNLGMTIIAEGVENVKQAAFLRSAGCSELQGFHLAHPTALADFEGSLRNRAA